MMNINNCSFAGRLADNVEFREATDNGAARATGRLIINRPSTKKDAGYDVIPFVAWGRYAETMAQYTHKGKELALTGSLRTNNARQADGSYKNYFELVVNLISLGNDAASVKVQKALDVEGAQEAVGAVEVMKALVKDPELVELVRQRHKELKEKTGKTEKVAVSATPETLPTIETPFG